MRILLFEDYELLLSDLRESFSQGGYELDYLAATELTLDGLVQLMHALVIVDIGLPAMDGLELAVQESGVEGQRNDARFASSGRSVSKANAGAAGNLELDSRSAALSTPPS